MPDWYTANFVWYCWIALTVLYGVGALFWQSPYAGDASYGLDILGVILGIGWVLYFVIWLST